MRAAVVFRGVPVAERNIPPRMRAVGFVPAGPARKVPEDAMLRPKSMFRRKDKPFLPSLADGGLEWLLGDLAPAERKALAFIVEHGDLIEPEGAPPHLLCPMTPAMLDVLAAFEADIEDRENDLADEPEAVELNGDEGDHSGCGW